MTIQICDATSGPLDWSWPEVYPCRQVSTEQWGCPAGANGLPELSRDRAGGIFIDREIHGEDLAQVTMGTGGSKACRGGRWGVKPALRSEGRLPADSLFPGGTVPTFSLIYSYRGWNGWTRGYLFYTLGHNIILLNFFSFCFLPPRFSFGHWAAGLYSERVQKVQGPTDIESDLHFFKGAFSSCLAGQDWGLD